MGAGEGVRVFGRLNPDLVKELRGPLDRAVPRIAHEVDGGRLIGGSATATSEALLGLLALQQAEPSAARAALAARTAELLVPLSAGTATGPRGARASIVQTRPGMRGVPDRPRRSRPPPSCLRVRICSSPQGRKPTRSGRGFFWPGRSPPRSRLMVSAKWFPQIAYGVSPIVEGYLALADATGERKYAVLAGLTSAWLLGANPAGVAMYDEASGRTFDGIDGPAASQVNRNAGAESTVESLLALQGVTRNADAAEYLRYRPVGDPAGSLANVPDRREFAGPVGGRVMLHRLDTGVELVESRGTAQADHADVLARGESARNAAGEPARGGVEPRASGHTGAGAAAARRTVDRRSSARRHRRARDPGRLAPTSRRRSSRVWSARGGVVRLDTIAPQRPRGCQSARRPRCSSSLRLPDGGIYAFPWKTNPEMLMYNVDLLAAAGVTPPRTHSELLDAFRRLARDTDGDGRFDRWALWAPLKTTWYERFYDFYPLYLASSGGRTFVSDGQVAFDNEAAVAAIEVLRQWVCRRTAAASEFRARPRPVRRRHRGDEDHRLVVPARTGAAEDAGPALRRDPDPGRGRNES